MENTFEIINPNIRWCQVREVLFDFDRMSLRVCEGWQYTIIPDSRHQDKFVSYLFEGGQ